MTDWTVDQLVYRSWTSWSKHMPRERYETMDAEKKARLLKAAAKEFAAHGYELASINTILDDAGLSKGSFYYYFEDKADLAATVLLTLSEPAIRITGYAEVHDAEQWWSELERVSWLQLRELESKKLEFEAITRLSNGMAKDPEFARRVMPALSPRVHTVMAFMETGVRVGAVRSDLPLPMLISILQSTKQSAYAHAFPRDVVPSDDELRKFSKLMLELAQRICRPPKG